MVKYSKKKSGKSWSFTFNKSDISTLKKDVTNKGDLYVCLVCADETTCILNGEEIYLVIDVNKSSQQWIKVELPPRSSMRVKGSLGDLPKTVPSNAFPDKIFAQMAA